MIVCEAPTTRVEARPQLSPQPAANTPPWKQRVYRVDGQPCWAAATATRASPPLPRQTDAIRAQSQGPRSLLGCDGCTRPSPCAPLRSTTPLHHHPFVVVVVIVVVVATSSLSQRSTRTGVLLELCLALRDFENLFQYFHTGLPLESCPY